MSEKFDFGKHQIDGEGEDATVIFLAGWDKYTSLDESQNYCEKITKSHYENFIVTNKFTPKEYVQDIQNIYAFCRYGDDLGDDAPFSNNLRWKLLDCWEIDLKEAARDDWSGNPRHPILRAVQHTAKKYSIPLEPFWKLIQAFKMDQKIIRYQTWDELQEYCIHSADPVGHLFLYVYGHDDAKLRKISDYTCTALQLANHWQDVARDFSQNRIYVPIEDMERFGYTMKMYQARLYNQQWKELMQFQVERTQSWFDKGSALISEVDPRLAVDLQMFTSGGEAILRSIEKMKYNTWGKRPTVSKFKQFMMLLKAKSMWKKANQ